MRMYTKEQLICYLKKHSEDLRKAPTIKEQNQSSYPSSCTYAKRFGSWNRALEAAGLKPNQTKKYDRSDLIESLKMLSKELGRTPRPADLKGKDWTASYSTYKKIFGTWEKAVGEAGLIYKVSPTLKRYCRS